MKILERHIEIDATPEQVWAVLTDFATYPDWNPFITAIEGTPTPGARLAVTLRPPAGRAITMKPTVTAAESSRRFAWLGRLGLPRVFDGAHELLVEPNGHGGTTFTQREEFRGVLVPFVGKVLDRTEDGFELMNQALKARVESLASVTARKE